MHSAAGTGCHLLKILHAEPYYDHFPVLHTAYSDPLIIIIITHQDFGESLIQLLAIRHRLELSPDTGLTDMVVIEATRETSADEGCVRVASGRWTDDRLDVVYGRRVLDMVVVVEVIGRGSSRSLL